ncbi:winged helix-turn-helix transcriptional regulator [Streptomyces heilongjiangensis]|uniref:Winged helix-turn-helix transcriptional regulator n=1 Tax=Streptomyces heilongjiangensis TaxID=945052 RepID=A0ABW1AYM2_9ACTN|nr:helix-turn-helix domain-containing protein [Streptomyces heilongjiangensis]MDC2947907.1 helix-turn-helix domain-containing protein [Streptomyces heilongjiangensis]
MSEKQPDPNLPGRPCSVAAALQVVGEKWALLAVREIMFGNHRFEALVRNTGAPRDRLAARLRALEEAGIVERRLYNERPARFEYHLTRSGHELEPVMRSLREWGDKWAMSRPPSVAMHRDHPLESSCVCRHCGEEVTTRDLSVEVLAPGWTLTGPRE